jgi:hypothetical membrane protein
LQKLNRTSPYYPIVSVFLFIVTIFISAFLYHGGTPFDYSSDYSFTHNFLSDLGRAETFAGGENTLSRIFFGVSLVCIASGLALSALHQRSVILLKGRGKKLSNTAFACGVIASIFLISSGVIPWDKMFWLHIWSVNFAFLFIFFYVTLLSAVQIINKVPKLFYLFNIFVSLSEITQLLLLIYGPNYRTPQGLPLHVTVQKIIVIIFLFNLLLQTYWVKNYK